MSLTKPPTGMTSVPRPAFQQRLPFILLFIVATEGVCFLFFLSHISELSEHGIWNKALNIHPVSEGALFFFFNAIEIIGLNNRVTFMH